MVEQREISKMHVSGTESLIFSIKLYGEKKYVDIRSYIDSKKYTGFTKKGIIFSVDLLKEFSQNLEKVKETNTKKNGLSNNDTNINENTDVEEPSEKKANKTEKEANKGEQENWEKELLEWYEMENSSRITNYEKQLEALKSLKKFKYTSDQIRMTMNYMIHKDKYWSGKMPDFVNVADNIHKLIDKAGEYYKLLEKESLEKPKKIVE